MPFRAHRPPRYEFAQNEFVTCMECVTLETLSTETGTKDFIAVSTTINRGEDLAVKGAVSSVCSWGARIWLKSIARCTSSKSWTWCRTPARLT